MLLKKVTGDEMRRLLFCYSCINKTVLNCTHNNNTFRLICKVKCVFNNPFQMCNHQCVCVCVWWVSSITISQMTAIRRCSLTAASTLSQTPIDEDGHANLFSSCLTDPHAHSLKASSSFWILFNSMCKVSPSAFRLTCSLMRVSESWDCAVRDDDC